MAENSPNALEQQIRDARRSISSDGYPMSIGELTNLYRDQELVIRPEFQRFFRWTDTQKSRLVESLLLGIPLPSIFVAQTTDGKWELVDGLQRVSTILQLQGELRDEDKDGLRPQLVLMGTKFLPGLEGRQWMTDDQTRSLTEAQRLDIKRSKIDIKIIKRESSPQTKFDLFQRLNSYGSTLTPQEMRSALLVAASTDFFSWLESLASYPSFKKCVALSERLIEERYDLELVLRFLVLHNRSGDRLTQSTLRDFTQLLDEESLALALNNPAGDDAAATVFRDTFDVLESHGGESVFRRWDTAQGVFKGSFLNTAFEVFALGMGYHIANQSRYREDVENAVKEFWSLDETQTGFATGRSTEARMSQFIPLGRRILSVG